MMKHQLTEHERKTLMLFQRAEITDHIIYHKLAAREKNLANKQILEKIANDEKDHYDIWKNYTNKEVTPLKFKIFIFNLLGILLGYTFVIKLMERGEYVGSRYYQTIVEKYSELNEIIKQEDEHEAELIGLLDEDRLNYIGSIVLGLNDALVELTGTIAGLTFAFSNNRLIALSGIITGISATISMAASNYLSQRAEENNNAFKSSLYTGFAYLITVVFLVAPYLLFPDGMYLAALIVMLVVVILIIAFFTFYVSVTKSISFKKQFKEMATISLSVALISFVIGLLVKHFLGIDV